MKRRCLLMLVMLVILCAFATKVVAGYSDHGRDYGTHGHHFPSSPVGVFLFVVVMIACGLFFYFIAKEDIKSGKNKDGGYMSIGCGTLAIVGAILAFLSKCS